MRNRFLAVLGALLLLVGLDAHAVIPENGWWWNPSTSGSGFNLEVQDDILFFAAFAYDRNGNPTWLTAGGRMSSDRDFTGVLSSYSGGSCLGCGYHAPLASDAGTVTLHFDSSQTATLTINGFSEPVQRFDFWLNTVAPDAMLGEWSMVIGDASTAAFFGERVQLRGRAVDSTGPYLYGNRLGASGDAAYVRYNAATDTYSMLLDSSPGYYRYSEWTQAGFNRIEGTTWVYPKGSSPSGGGTFFQAYRSASAAFVQTGSGPASTKAAPVHDAAAATARDAAQASVPGQGPVFDADAARVERYKQTAKLIESR